MRKFILYITACFFLASCEDILDSKRQNEWNEKDVWRIPELAEGILLAAYVPIQNRPDCFEDNFLDCVTDNAVTNSFATSIYKFGQGGVTAYNNPLDNWSTAYEQIQNINQFFENGLNSNIRYNFTDTISDAGMKIEMAFREKLKGEAHFLRAWWGFQLLQRYGGKSHSGEALGYPIMLRFVTHEEAANPQNFVRNTYQQCVDQIVADCDSAIAKLPVIYLGNDAVAGDKFTGRATSVAAAILKVNALLYGASPAYQPDNIVRINGMGSFTVVDEQAYKEKWERLALFAHSVLKDSVNGKFGQFGDFYGVKYGDLANFKVSNDVKTPSEFIFRRLFTNNNIEIQHYPPYYFGNARTTPSQNLVDAFPMANGYPVTDRANSGYDPQNPYAGRDKRFDLNIAYHGARFIYRDSVQYSIAKDTLDIAYGGKDSPSFDRKSTRTGYYLGKFIARKPDMLEPTVAQTATHYNPLLRRAEVFLAFAEASNEVWGPRGTGTNCEFSAYDIIRSVRMESGGITDTRYLDQMATDKDNFRKLIQNERRLEFAFENRRFFDMRRCLLPLNEPVKGVKITRKPNQSLEYEIIEIERRNMDDVKYYYMPIPYGEILKNPALVNNLGWN